MDALAETRHDDRHDPARRRFLALHAAALALATIPAARVAAQEAEQEGEAGADEESGEEAITERTIAEAEKLAGVTFSPEERRQLLETIRSAPEGFAARREFPLPNELGPSTVFRAEEAAGLTAGRADASTRVRLGRDDAPRRAASDVDIAFAPIAHLGAWLRRGEISSEELTRLCVDRIERLDPKLECVVTITRQRALEQARRADRELRAGRDRGPLHGIPYGAKDLFDTAGVRTTYGAAPYKDRVAERDAAVVQRLEEAGAVLVAKTTLGALAYGDIWFGGRTNNPWNLEQGSSGSSAGSASGVAAGLYPFALGTETLGSLVSPSMRCGTTAIRPTFGRVARTGAMALCWSLDKIGPIARTVDDCALVLAALNGADAGDPSSIDRPFTYDARRRPRRLRVGHRPEWFEGDSEAGEIHRRALEALKTADVEFVEIDLPGDVPWGSLYTILTVEAAAAFEAITLEKTDRTMKWQEARAWPNTFRQMWLTPAVEFVQAERVRRSLCQTFNPIFDGVDAVFGPSFAGPMLLATNFTGHPSLVLRTGFRSDGTPHGMSLWGRLFDEGTLCHLGSHIERELGVWDERPAMAV